MDEFKADKLFVEDFANKFNISYKKKDMRSSPLLCLKSFLDLLESDIDKATSEESKNIATERFGKAADVLVNEFVQHKDDYGLLNVLFYDINSKYLSLRFREEVRTRAFDIAIDYPSRHIFSHAAYLLRLVTQKRDGHQTDGGFIAHWSENRSDVTSDEIDRLMKTVEDIGATEAHNERRKLNESVWNIMGLFEVVARGASYENSRKMLERAIALQKNYRERGVLSGHDDTPMSIIIEIVKGCPIAIRKKELSSFSSFGVDSVNLFYALQQGFIEEFPERKIFKWCSLGPKGGSEKKLRISLLDVQGEMVVENSYLSRLTGLSMDERSPAEIYKALTGDQPDPMVALVGYKDPRLTLSEDGVKWIKKINRLTANALLKLISEAVEINRNNADLFPDAPAQFKLMAEALEPDGEAARKRIAKPNKNRPGCDKG